MGHSLIREVFILIVIVNVFLDQIEASYHELALFVFLFYDFVKSDVFISEMNLLIIELINRLSELNDFTIKAVVLLPLLLDDLLELANSLSVDILLLPLHNKLPL